MAVLHPIKRAQDRYGVTLSVWDLEDLEQQIRTGRARFVLETGQGGTIYLVQTLNNYRLYAVYRPEIGRIVTFLPPSFVRRKKERAMSDGVSKVSTTLNFDIEAIVETEGDGYVLYHPDDPSARFSGATVTEAFKQLMPYVLANADFEFADA